VTLCGAWIALKDALLTKKGTIAEPDVVVRSVRNARTSIPRSISPIKTHINGSARRPIPRTTAQLSSPSGNVNGGTPSQPPVNRQLDFSMDKTRTISKLSPRNPSSISSKGLKKTTTDKRGKKKGPFDLAADSDEGEPEASAMNEMSIDNGVAQDDYMPNIDDEPLNPDVTMESIEEQDQALVPEEEPLDMEPEPEVTTGATAPPKRPSGRPAKASLGNPDESVMSLGGTGARRGRPPKKPKTEVYQDENAAKPAAPAAAKGKRKAGTSERDPNIKVKAPRTNSKAPASRAPSVAPSRSYIVQRSETPATDSGAFVTRSGRHSFKPLASWRGEHVVLGQRETADTLPAITDIVRTDEMMAPPRKRSASVRPGPGKRRARPQLAAVEEEEEEELEPWEAETGIQYAQVMSWNAEAAKYEEDHTTETGKPCCIATPRYIMLTYIAQKLPTPPTQSKCATSAARPSNSPKRSRSPSSARAWSTCPPAARNASRTRAKCKWCFSSSTAASLSTWARRPPPSVLAGGGSGRFRGVCHTLLSFVHAAV